MPIAPSVYNSQLPDVCRSLARRTLGVINSYEGGHKLPDDDVDTLENMYRLLEMHRARNYSMSSPSGVLGADPSHVNSAQSYEANARPALLVQTHVESALQSAFQGIDESNAIQRIEEALAKVAYASGQPEAGIIVSIKAFLHQLERLLTTALSAAHQSASKTAL